MRVSEIWRFPVKSLGGERLEDVEALGSGLAGDRAFAIFDVVTGVGLTARRRPELLEASAVLLADGTARITLPDGSEVRGDEDLSRWLGTAVTLRAADDAGERQYENPDDAEDEAGSWRLFDGSRGAFHDSGRASYSLVSQGNLGGWDRRRFRANLVVEGLLEGRDEDALVGEQVSVGSAELTLDVPVPRCVMVTRAQPGGIEVDRDVLRRIHRERGGTLSVGGLVRRPGTVRVGDEVRLVGAAEPGATG